MKKRILLVESDPQRANDIFTRIRELGHDCLPISSMDPALEMVKCTDHHFDFLFVGLSLPEKAGEPKDPFAGFKLALKIRQEIPDIAVVFSTKLDLSMARGLMPTGLRLPVKFLPERLRPNDIQRAIFS